MEQINPFDIWRSLPEVKALEIYAIVKNFFLSWDFLYSENFNHESTLQRLPFLRD